MKIPWAFRVLFLNSLAFSREQSETHQYWGDRWLKGIDNGVMHEEVNASV
jgi:hypothetical protein